MDVGGGAPKDCMGLRGRHPKNYTVQGGTCIYIFLRAMQNNFCFRGT